MLVAKAMFKLRVHIVGISVKDPLHTINARIGRVIAQFNKQFGCNYEPGSYHLSEEYIGPGFGAAYKEELFWVQRLARLEGIFLDPVCSLATSLSAYSLRLERYQQEKRSMA